ncbi:uncharacterized protein EKO05_0003013 [Ascochyta rabiei]|uniref:Uncharacterized protein n=1 Tax=Didymella rabiei TaxID=5454 RepID=A0A162XAQ0_DIDRA|nr:uncharacterized protein EKO05_0003013 [Ascochyta rabiei]KZM19437.1 hypothetical protein ST47_g9419 [Ascochyta rabiei]UPX12467.1 hypothetical protein EKO05_0003013 [Ascochyta rabiei]
MPRPPTSSPPPASFPFTAGSFDYPHASTSPSNATQPIAWSVLRLVEEPPERSPAHLQQLRSTSQETSRRVNQRRRLHRLLGSPHGSDETVYSLLRRPPSANPHRLRATPSERYLQRAQARIDEERDAIMNSATEPFDSLSERPPIVAGAERTNIPNRHSSPGAPDTTQRRTKRRKLDHESSRNPECKTYKYGYKGQMVPGRLRMEVVSCDGGQIRRDNPMRIYDVENVLKNDKSVYCSESSKCNLLLKHIGDAPFALEKVVIRAPDRGFTSPVQEGLVFVAMSPEQLLSGTSAYRLEHRSHSSSASPSPRRGAPTHNEEQISLREAIDDADVWQHSRRRMQDDVELRIERLRLRTRQLNQESRARAEPNHQRTLEPSVASDEEIDFDCDYTTSAGVSAPTPPPFNVTTTSEEEEEEEEEEGEELSNDDYPNVETMADRIQREGRWRPSSDDEDEDVVSRRGTGARFRQLLETAQFADDHEMRSRRIAIGPRYRDLLDNTEPIRASRLTRPSRIEAGNEDAETGNVLAPHARFFIKKNRNKITIKFEPAISGRNILLKLWSPKDSEDGNIDIESVQFYGYSGPRFFQATQAC